MKLEVSRLKLKVSSRETFTDLRCRVKKPFGKRKNIL